MTSEFGVVGIKRVGTGQYYLVAIKDKRGESFDGAKIFDSRRRRTHPSGSIGR